MNLELFDKLFDEASPSQNKDEWRIFLEICDSYLKEHKIKNPLVVELGIWKGRQRPFYEQLFGATYIGIDRSKKRCRPEIQGLTTDPKILERLKVMLAGRRINILFVDARHEYKNVKSDFEMYAPLCDDIVAFHDVNYPSIRRLWNELKAKSDVRNVPPDLSKIWPKLSTEEKGWTSKSDVFVLIEITSGIGVIIKK